MTEAAPHLVQQKQSLVAEQMSSEKKCNSKQQSSINPKLLTVIAQTLESQLCLTEKVVNGSELDQQQSDFHQEKVPQITLQKYMERIKKFTFLEDQIFIMALIYIERFASVQSVTKLTPNTIHRLLFTATLMAIKYSNDVCYKNEYYAKVGGMKRPDLNKMEIAFLETIDHRLYINEDEYQLCQEKITVLSKTIQ